MTGFNTGTGANQHGTAHGTPFTFTVPAVTTGDVMIACVGVFAFNPATASMGTPTSGGGNWTQISTLQQSGVNSGLAFYATYWWRIATGSDASSTFSIAWTGATGTTDQYFWVASLDSYTGFFTSGTPVGAFSFAASTTTISNAPAGPTTTTAQPGSWGLQSLLMAVSSSGTISGTPSTQRTMFNAGDGDVAGLADTNGSAGAAGSSIGGGTWTTSGQGWWVEATIELLTAGTPAVPQAEPPAIPHPRVLHQFLEEAWQRADWQAQGVADLTVAFSSTSGGVDTYNVTSPYNGTGSHPMRVLKPSAANKDYPHAFLIMLPVEPDQGTVFGDSIGTAQSISAHNAYNLTIVQPGYAGIGSEGPWYSDNPLDPTISQETFLLKLLDWIKKNLATSGGEKTYLIGFSRSGLGGQGMQFRHPYLFAATASWDAPFLMTDYDGTDPTAGFTIGGNPQGSYGTSSNFQTRYQLTAAHLGFWQATGQYGVNRIWIGQGPSFPDTPVYDAALTTAGIPHTYVFHNTGETHAWQTDWVASALASIIPGGYAQATTTLPQQIHRQMLAQLLEVAEYRLTTGTQPAASGTANAVLASGTGAAQGPAAAIAVNAGLASGTGTAQSPVAAIGVNAALASGAGTAQGATASTSASGTANAVLAAGTGTAQSPVAAIGVNAAAATGTGAAQGATVQTSGSTNVTAVLAAGTGTAQSPAAAIAVNAAAATGTGTAPGAGRAAAAGLASATGAAQAASTSLAAQALAGAAQALAAALNASGAGVEPFTVGTLTASDAPGGGGGILTAADQRTGGPS